MLKAEIRKKIVTKWILSNAEYQKLQLIDKEIKDYIYELSWRGFEKYNNKYFQKYLKYFNGILDYNIYIDGYEDWKYFYYYSQYKNSRIEMYDPLVVNLNYKVKLYEKTLYFNWNKLKEIDKSYIIELINKKKNLVKNLITIVENITETLLNPLINITYIKKYYPDLLTNENIK